MVCVCVCEVGSATDTRERVRRDQETLTALGGFLFGWKGGGARDEMLRRHGAEEELQRLLLRKRPPPAEEDWEKAKCYKDLGGVADRKRGCTERKRGFPHRDSNPGLSGESRIS